MKGSLFRIFVVGHGESKDHRDWALRQRLRERSRLLRRNHLELLAKATFRDGQRRGSK